MVDATGRRHARPRRDRRRARAPARARCCCATRTTRPGACSPPTSSARSRRSSTATAPASSPTRCTRRSSTRVRATSRTRPCRTPRPAHDHGDVGVEGVQPRRAEVRAGGRDEPRRRRALATASGLRGRRADTARDRGVDRRVPRRRRPGCAISSRYLDGNRRLLVERLAAELPGDHLPCAGGDVPRVARLLAPSASTTRLASSSTTPASRSATARRSARVRAARAAQLRHVARCSSGSSARWVPHSEGEISGHRSVREHGGARVATRGGGRRGPWAPPVRATARAPRDGRDGLGPGVDQAPVVVDALVEVDPEIGIERGSRGGCGNRGTSQRIERSVHRY